MKKILFVTLFLNLVLLNQNIYSACGNGSFLIDRYDDGHCNDEYDCGDRRKCGNDGYCRPC